MRFDDNYGGDPNYVGSSIKPTVFYQDVKKVSPQTLSLHTEHEKWTGEVSTFTSEISDADFVQPAALWEVIGRDPGHQDRLIENLVSSVKGVKYPELRKAVYGRCLNIYMFCAFLPITSLMLTWSSELFSRVNTDLGMKLRDRTEKAIKTA